MTQILDLAVIPGDGIGPEVVAEGLKVLEAAVKSGGGRARAVAPANPGAQTSTHPQRNAGKHSSHGEARKESLSSGEKRNAVDQRALPEQSDKTDIVIRTTHYDLGAKRYNRTGEILTADDLSSLCTHHAILLGAVGDPSVPSGVLERGLLLKLRFSLDHYVNLRPIKYYPGVPTPLASPGDIDFLVVREGTEGLYCGNGGTLRKGTPQEIATEVSVNTAYGVERLVRYAFAKAQARPRKKLTYIHKHNVLVNAGGLWTRIVEKVAADYPDVVVDYMHVDAATIFLITDPERFDVIVTDNLFGDILTDEAGAVSGGVGLAASGNINPEGVFPSMFEPIHGSAPDIAGKQLADPVATIACVALLLDHLGLHDRALAIERAIEEDMRRRAEAAAKNKPLKRTTAQIGSDIADSVAIGDAMI